MSSTFLRSRPWLAAQSKNVLSCQRRMPFAVQRDEDLRRKPRLLAERLERVVDLRERNPALLEHHRNAAELHVRRHRLEPALQDRLEFAAMRAAVGKELDDLDLLAGLDRLRILEPQILVAFLRRGHLRGRAKRQRRGECRQRGRQGGAKVCAAGACSNSPSDVNARWAPRDDASSRHHSPALPRVGAEQIRQNLITATSKPRLASSPFIRLSSSVLS